MTDVNIPLLRKAVEWAEGEAAKPYEVGQWHQDYVVVRAVVAAENLGKSPECGTCYCIAGYVAMVETGMEDPYASPDLGGSICGYAADRLGLDRNSGDLNLFAMGNTIQDVRRIAEQIAGERL